MSLGWNRQRAAHLYRRAAFGGAPAEIDRAVAIGREAAVDRLVHFEDIATDQLDARLAGFGFDLTTYILDHAERRAQGESLMRWWSLRLTYTPRPLEEKMTLFWHGHFATSGVKVYYPQLLYRQNQIFRTMGMGRFGDLLLEVSRDPAMLLWLDNATNVKDAPNENFAREVMELFTMGVGHYSQKDVTEAARSFTGWTVDPENGFAFVFDASRHDDGPKVFLGAAGNHTGEDICRILAARPETAAFVTEKLARFFLGRPPQPALARRLQDLYLEQDGEIRVIVREILLSEDFDESADRADAFKSPTELVVGALRALGAGDDGELLTASGFYMGQGLFLPPNVAGWKGGKSWINTGVYALRMSTLLGLIADRDGGELQWDCDAFFAGQDFHAADELIDFLIDRLNMITPSASLRQALRDFLADAGEPLAWSADAADRWGRGAIHLLMVSPEYQLQ